MQYNSLLKYFNPQQALDWNYWVWWMCKLYVVEQNVVPLL